MVYFGHYVEVADSTVELGHDYLQKKRPGNPNIIWDSLLRGVCCFHAAQTTPKNTTKGKQYAKVAQMIRKKIRRWKSLGNPNVDQHVELLDAEWNAFKGDYAAAAHHYDRCISIAARGGCLHDAAFASERLSEFQLEKIRDRHQAMESLKNSLAYWREWGAKGKVTHLEQKQKLIAHSKEKPQIKIRKT